MIIRQNWYQHFGPGRFAMPDDGTLPLLSGPYPQIHEDAEDCINADGTHGPEGIYSPGGSGIVMGYSRRDYDNVLLLEAATHNRTAWYDGEHSVRQFRYAIARTEMMRDNIGPRRVIQYANYYREKYSETGPVFFGAGWVPDNLHQLHEQALATPGVGLQYMNLRQYGWVAYVEAMACRLDPNRSRAWLTMLLSTCSMAAIPGTGQIGCGPNSGGEVTTPVNVQYTFHWGILAHGVICTCRVLGLPIPTWIIDGMNSYENMAPVAYYGVQSLPAFVYSQNGSLMAATGPGQHGDPAFGWWSTNCAALCQATGSQEWKQRALKWGPTSVVDEQSRKFTMLLRGIS